MTTTSPGAVAPNLFLMGPFAPVAEEVSVTDLRVTGTIPDWLDGRYLRNGPNPIAPDPATYHWFAGDGMVHGLRLRDGRAEWYRNRWVRPADDGNEFGGMIQPPNTNVIGHAGRFYAIAEAGAVPHELTGNLDTVGPCTFDGALAGGYTAHPHRDPRTGDLHAVSYFLGEDGDVRYQYSVLAADGRITRVVDLEIGGTPFMHDFALSESYAVVLDLPGRVELAPPDGHFPAGWDPDHNARVGLLPRDGEAADMRWFEVEPCYVFHPLNAYEEGETVVVDVVRYPSMFAQSHQGPDATSTLDRWTIDRRSGIVHEERVDDRWQEFPRFDERLGGRPHRYGYTADLTGAVLKHDYLSGTTAAHGFEPGDFAGEFVFVPSAPDSGEDDGVLMGLVQRAATDTCDLVLLDAASLESVATVHLPVRVPAGFHGNWVPS